MIKIFSALLFITILMIHPATAQMQSTQYTCPMHPHYVSDHAGSCPICGMDLVPMNVEHDHSNHEGHSNAQETLQGEKNTKEKSNQTASHERARVKLSSQTIQNMGIRTEYPRFMPFGQIVSAYGNVTENLRLQSDVSGRISGWIKALSVKVEGDQVTKGDLLFTLDSPELISVQQDYLSAIRTGIRGRINATKKRLKSFGMQDIAIKNLSKRGKVYDFTPFYAAQNGIVSSIHVREGSHITSGTKILQIQDYSSVWVNANIAEKDTPYIDEATKAYIAFPKLGLQPQEAKIDYVHPTINAQTRTGQIRLIADNSDGKKKPGAYADITLETNVKMRLSIPGDAVLKSKDGDFVIIAEENGQFQPRQITLGLHNKGRIEVIDGLRAKDAIVVSGQFLIDSESALKDAFRKMKKPQEPEEKQFNGAGHEHH